MGLLDELKKLTKPFDDDEFYEEELAEQNPAGGMSYAQYAAQMAQPQVQPVQSQQQVYPFAQAQPQARPMQQAQPQVRPMQQPQAQPMQQQAYYPQNNVISFNAPVAAPAASPRLLMVKPDRYEVVTDVIDRMAEGNAILLNLEDTEATTARRILDCLSGASYALGGKSERISGKTFVITPRGLEVMNTGDVQPNYFG